MPFPPAMPAPPLVDRSTAHRPLAHSTVLVVDDSRFACDALRLILQKAGARMRRADSLEIARLHLGCYRPDLVIVDLGLPDGRGEDLIAELAQQGFPVLGLSGEPEGRERALAAGARLFLEKPVASVTMLVRAILDLVPVAAAPRIEDSLATPAGDLLALRDDLRQAAALIQTRGDPAYALSFLRGLARAADDPELEKAACVATTPFDRARLACMIEARILSLCPAF